MAQLKISADTGGVKKSILELGKSIKNLGTTKVSIFSEDDRKFIKTELSKELVNMRTRLKQNKAAISDLIKEQKALTKGTKEELDARQKILNGYREQTKLAKDIEAAESQKKRTNFTGGMAGGGALSKMAGMAAGGIAAAAVAALAYGAVRTMQAGTAYGETSKDRIRLRGMGVEGDNFGTPQQLAEAGMSEKDMVARQMQTTSRLGRQGSSQQSILDQSRFERAYGLENGSMMNTSMALRATMGGKGADQAQQKIQAAVLASGIEDAVAPYLESMTSLLENINENGLTNTDEITRIFTQLSKDAQRTPEQIASAFTSLDAALKNSTGERNAFLQNAFAKAGIGGGTIGGTRAALESGGVFGLDADKLKQQGYNPKLIQNMTAAGLTGGVQKRSGALLSQFKQNSGLSNNSKISDITDVTQKTMTGNMANSVFGTKGEAGFQALLMLEQVRAGKMKETEFNKKLSDLQKDPVADRLGKVNDILASQLDVQTNIRDSLMQVLGKNGGAQSQMVAKELDIQGIRATTNTVGAINDTGVIDAARRGTKATGDYALGGHLADLPETLSGLRDSFAAFVQRNLSTPTRDANSIKTPMNLNVKILNGDGKVSNKTHK